MKFFFRTIPEAYIDRKFVKLLIFNYSNSLSYIRKINLITKNMIKNSIQTDYMNVYRVLTSLLSKRFASTKISNINFFFYRYIYLTEKKKTLKRKTSYYYLKI
jgi:hypothetical protein